MNKYNIIYCTEDPKYKNLIDFYRTQYKNKNIKKDDLVKIIGLINTISLSNKKLEEYNKKIINKLQ